jgi:hypothetical protein
LTATIQYLSLQCRGRVRASGHLSFANAAMKH